MTKEKIMQNIDILAIIQEKIVIFNENLLEAYVDLYHQLTENKIMTKRAKTKLLLWMDEARVGYYPTKQDFIAKHQLFNYLLSPKKQEEYMKSILKEIDNRYFIVHNFYFDKYYQNKYVA